MYNNTKWLQLGAGDEISGECSFSVGQEIIYACFNYSVTIIVAIIILKQRKQWKPNYRLSQHIINANQADLPFIVNNAAINRCVSTWLRRENMSRQKSHLGARVLEGSLYSKYYLGTRNLARNCHGARKIGARIFSCCLHRKYKEKNRDRKVSSRNP